MKTYRKPRAFTRADATRKVLREYNARSKTEQHIGPIESEMVNLAKTIRTRLVAKYPSASDAEIDAKLERLMNAGRPPTTETPPAPRGIPKDIIAARQAERRKQVRKGQRFRK
jgi:hypothetical protein